MTDIEEDMTEPAPGPWKWKIIEHPSGCWGWTLHDRDDVPVLRVADPHHQYSYVEPDPEDARLIAAAPDLYEALKATRHILTDKTPAGEEVLLVELTKVGRLVLAALAKAEGSEVSLDVFKDSLWGGAPEGPAHG